MINEFVCLQECDMSHSCHQTRFWALNAPKMRLWLARWGSLQHSPRPPSCVWGAASRQGRGGKRREGKGKEGRRGKGEGREGEGWEGRDMDPRNFENTSTPVFVTQNKPSLESADRRTISRAAPQCYQLHVYNHTITNTQHTTLYNINKYIHLYLLLLFWRAPLGVHSAQCRHQSPKWTILSHIIIASFTERLLDFRSCRIVFIHVVRECPGGLLQFSKGRSC